MNGILPRDIEDMAISHDSASGNNYIYLADIGDNYSFYHQIKIYRVPEPILNQPEFPFESEITSDIETMLLRYPYMKRDAEALMVDPLDQQVYIVTKREAHSRLYTAGKFSLTQLPGVRTIIGISF